MPTIANPNSPVFDDFFAPILNLDLLDHTRKCPVLDDVDWLLGGISRVLHPLASGRDFLQSFAPNFDVELERSHYFETLKSNRRLNLVAEAATRVVGQMNAAMPDNFAGVDGLENFEVYAGDGHWHEHATHDQAKSRCSGEGATQTKYAVGHLYGINLRTRSLFHLIASDEITRKKEHDMRALKRLDAGLLRQGALKGGKVLWIWDRAGIDFAQWHKWKQSRGVYFLSRAKSNMNTSAVARRPWDRDDPINAGIEEDGFLAEGPQIMIRMVRFRDPLTDEVFEFITNEMTLGPGVIAQLYRMRWDIEKSFDDFKNKLGELKAWASSPTAKTMQAQFLCLAHNLLAMFEQELAEAHGVAYEAENARRAHRLSKEQATAVKTDKYN